MRPALSILSLVLCFALSAGAAQAQSYAFFRVDGPGGVQANGGVFEPALSADGRVLVFSVGSGSLLSGGAAGAQVVALDLGSAALSVVSRTPGGQASAASTVNEKAVASANGRFVAFDTGSSTYTGGAAGVHGVRIDRVTGTAALVNLTASGTLPTGTLSRVGGISGDGRYVVFSSNASGLVAGDAGSSSFAVYVRDLSAGTTQRIDLTPGGGPGNGGAGGERPTISEDGRWVAFASSASNLLGTQISGSVRIYLRDRISGTTTQVSLGPGGSDLSGARNPVISPDGSLVVFGSAAGSASATQLWARRLNQPAAVAVPAAAGMGICDIAQVSNTGLVIAQCRRGVGQPAQAYAWSLAQPALPPELISGSDAGNTVPGNGASGARVAVSRDAGVFAFDSLASDLVIGDTNSASDVFVYALPAVLEGLFSDGFE